MKSKIKVSLLFTCVVVAVFLNGCSEPGQQVGVQSAGGGNFNVQKLFTTEGVSVYRFEDGGSNRYFSAPAKKTENFSSEVNWDEGHHDNEHMSVPYVGK